MGCLYCSGDQPDQRVFVPKGTGLATPNYAKSALATVSAAGWAGLPGMDGFDTTKSGNSAMQPADNPSSCAMACDAKGTSGTSPYFSSTKRNVLYQDGSVKAQGSVSVGVAGSPVGSDKDLNLLKNE